MMKKTTSLFLILFSLLIVYSQKHDIEWIAHKEKKNGLQQNKANPNTANYDVTSHKIEITVNPSVRKVSGKVTTKYTALADMSKVTFDLVSQMIVSSVKQNNTALSFVQSAKELVITLPTVQTAGTSAIVEIDYAGVPPDTGHVFFTTHSGSPTFFTLSESFGDMEWWPCKQDMTDKIESLDLYITAPSQYVSVGNGVEPEPPVVSGGNKTTHFHHSYPIPAYLVSVAVANYSTFSQTGGTSPDTFPIINYVYPENLTLAQNNLAQVPSFISFYESLLGTYPYHAEKYGNAEVTTSGMEHPTVSFISDYDRYMMEHELAHQWFGDKITCATWNDIWLNEGFATFMDQLLIEHFDGNGAGLANRANMINYITSLPGGAVYLTDAQATNEDNIFNARLSYYKGAMVLNMLRHKMGETLFLQGLKNYINDPLLVYKTATTPDFIAHMEAVYGSSLTDFFDSWIYKQGYPIYNIKAQNLGSGKVNVTIAQTQSHSSVSFFKMKVPVQFTGSGGQTYNTTLENTVNNESFIIDVPFTITGVKFDPERQIISKISTAVLDITDIKLQKENLEIFPNPIKNILNIQTEAKIQKVEIYSTNGQLVKTSFQKETNVANLTKGNYVVKITTDKGVQTEKIIKD